MTAPDSLTFHHIRESVPSERWQVLFQALWPGYRAWYLQDGDAARPCLDRAEQALRQYMPAPPDPLCAPALLSDSHPVRAP